MRVFVDTGGFAALYNARDEYHETAKRLWKECAAGRFRLYTSNYIVAETATLLRVRAGHPASVQFGQDVFSSAVVKIVRTTEAQDARAWQIFRKYADQDFSFVDCSSFALMQDLSISKAFAFDQHFTVAGFECLRPS